MSKNPQLVNQVLSGDEVPELIGLEIIKFKQCFIAVKNIGDETFQFVWVFSECNRGTVRAIKTAFLKYAGKKKFAITEDERIARLLVKIGFTSCELVEEKYFLRSH